MRIWLLIPVIGMLSCGGSTDKKKEKLSVTDSAVPVLSDTTKTTLPPPTIAQPGPEETAFNNLLKERYPGSWHVLNDAEATWMKDAFDYFIAPKRKDNPVYPYMTTGDFNGDGKPDRAALITDSSKRNYQLAIILDSTVITWKEDIIEDAALSTVPRSVITGTEGEKEKKVKMRGDGINVEYFEKASFVLYWDKKGFKRLQTGD
jgi:hypothetical protein